jgi:hypothetical protein
MIPFQEAYLMVCGSISTNNMTKNLISHDLVGIMFVLLAGNHAQVGFYC